MLRMRHLPDLASFVSVTGKNCEGGQNALYQVLGQCNYCNGQATKDFCTQSKWNAATVVCQSMPPTSPSTNNKPLLHTIVLLFFIASAQGVHGPASAEASPDVHVIIQRSVQANDADWKAAPAYDYFERDRQPDGSTKTFQVSMIDGSPYSRLVAVNEKPLSSEQQVQEQKKMDEVSAERRNESQTARNHRIAKYQKERQRDYSLMQELPTAFDFTLAGQQKLDGFDVYVFQATPRRGYHPPSFETRVLTGMKGQLWIDTKTYQWVKVEAEVIHPVSIIGFLARVDPGTRFELEKAPVADGVWLAKHFSMMAHAKVLSMFSHDSSADETYWDYRKAGSSSTSSTGK